MGVFLQHKLDEEDFDISNHQKIMRHTMRLERKGGGSVLAWRVEGRWRTTPVDERRDKSKETKIKKHPTALTPAPNKPKK